MNLPRLSNGDPGSFSNPEDVIVSHMDLFLNVDFSNETFSGYVTLTAVIKNSTATELILDSRNLHVEKITSPNDDIELSYAFGESIHTFGRKLTVKLPQPVSEKLLVKIEYHTDPGATALYWLKPHQTVGGKHPFVFSQCQPDHCRSIIPCQDSPGVKGTYNAIVTVLSEELRVVMSAMQLEELNAERNVKPEFRFSQTIPIPAYLIAIAVGNLEKRKIGPCSTVWTEPEIINEAEYEFKEIDLLLKTAEDICGPYVWTIYDIVVLPPSFPFGGMENSCVTFVTPTVLVGDRSLLYVIAHEISHSWSGNLVSAKNFEHFWLNEGFATFIERKIGGRLKGEAYRQFRAIGGIRELRLTVKALGEDNPFTQLVVDLTGIDPDDTFSNVVYEKGHTFLFYLEQLLGGPEKFERFLRSYFREFERQAIDTNNFKLCLLTFYRGTKNLKLIDWDQWLYSTGMPYIIPEYDNSLQIPCILLVERWIKWQQNTPHSFRETDLKSFMSEQVEEFLALLLEKIPLPVPKLRLMNHLYKMNSFKNSEIRVRWLRICIQSRWMEQMDLALNFATEQKQVKYVCPIFRYFNEQFYVSSSSEAREYFKQNPEEFLAYHDGYEHQSSLWPVNPVDEIIKEILKRPKVRDTESIADFGCGRAKIAQTLDKDRFKVFSFDLVAVNNCVTPCDMAHTNLFNNCIDIAVFCLSLMSSNISDCIKEANRVLKEDGLLKIAEVKSRFEKADDFIKYMDAYGFVLLKKKLNDPAFYYFDFKKKTKISKKKKKNLPELKLHPCLYKHR